MLAKTPALNPNQNNNPPSLYSATPKDMASCPQIQESYEEQDIQLHLACPHLVRAAEICLGDTEVQANIIRTLSVLSEHQSCCDSLSDSSSRLGILLGPNVGDGLTAKPLGQIIRIGYILGNIMARFDSARSQVNPCYRNCFKRTNQTLTIFQFFNNDVAMEYLLSTLEHFTNKNFANPNQTGDSIIDVLIKLVRVIANMSVNNEVGYGLGVRQSLGSVLLTILLAVNNCKTNLVSFSCFNSRSEKNLGISQSLDLEELLLATLGALHNLSFYQVKSQII